MIEEIKDGYVKVEKEHGIVTIEFHHPQSNSLPGQILDALAKDIHAESLHKDTKVFILRSTGDSVFCSGASFDELAAIKDEKEGTKFFSGFANVINAMRRCPKFVIGRVQGNCESERQSFTGELPDPRHKPHGRNRDSPRRHPQPFRSLRSQQTKCLDDPVVVSQRFAHAHQHNI